MTLTFISRVIREFKNKIFALNVIISILLSFLICFEKEDWKGYNILWSILVIIPMSFIFFHVVSEATTICLLKFNSLSFDKTEEREFKLNKDIGTENEVFGVYTHKKYFMKDYGLKMKT